MASKPKRISVVSLSLLALGLSPRPDGRRGTDLVRGSFRRRHQEDATSGISAAGQASQGQKECRRGAQDHRTELLHLQGGSTDQGRFFAVERRGRAGLLSAAGGGGIASIRRSDGRIGWIRTDRREGHRRGAGGLLRRQPLFHLDRRCHAEYPRRRDDPGPIRGGQSRPRSGGLYGRCAAGGRPRG